MKAVIIGYREKGGWWCYPCEFSEIETVRAKFDYTFPIPYFEESKASEIAIAFEIANLKPETIEALGEAMALLFAEAN